MSRRAVVDMQSYIERGYFFLQHVGFHGIPTVMDPNLSSKLYWSVLLDRVAKF